MEGLKHPKIPVETIRTFLQSPTRGNLLAIKYDCRGYYCHGCPFGLPSEQMMFCPGPVGNPFFLVFKNVSKEQLPNIYLRLAKILAEYEAGHGSR